MTRGREGERKECWPEVGVINSEQQGKTQLPGEDKGKEETVRDAGNPWGKKTPERTQMKPRRSAALISFGVQHL